MSERGKRTKKPDLDETIVLDMMPIKQLRIMYGLSQPKMLKVLGLDGEYSNMTLSNWEKGIHEPPIKVLQRYAYAFDVKIEDLIPPLDEVDKATIEEVWVSKEDWSPVPVEEQWTREDNGRDWVKLFPPELKEMYDRRWREINESQEAHRQKLAERSRKMTRQNLTNMNRRRKKKK